MDDALDSLNDHLKLQGNGKKCLLGLTSLMLASWHGHLNVVKYLAENGANINVKDTFWGGKFIFAFDGTAAFI